MSNNIPLLEGTDGAGGYLVRDEFRFGLQEAINRLSPTWGICRQERAARKRQKWTVYAGRPTAGFVAEGAAKGVTGAEFKELTCDIKKIATTVLYTEELLEDAQDDPTVLVNMDVEKAFADLIDAHVLGYAAGSAITGSFNSELASSTNSVELGTGADAFALSVSQQIANIEGNGYTPTHVVAGFDVKAHLRDQRHAGDLVASPVYTNGFGREPDTIYGLPIRWTTNLDGFAAGAGKVAAVVGDFSQAIAVTRSDMSVRFSDTASIDVSGTLHHLFQENKVAALWEMRVGFIANDLNRAFGVIANAS